eukprot:213517-Karenia_brevis.AAC.1
MVIDVSGKPRLPSVRERSRLMGFPSEHVYKMFNKHELAMYPEYCLDEMGGALGNTFHCIVVARAIAGLSPELEAIDCNKIWTSYFEAKNVLGRLNDHVSHVMSLPSFVSSANKKAWLSREFDKVLNTY